MLSVSGCRLKGSVGELRRWRRMMERSMMFPEGRITGSVIKVSISGSEGGETYKYYAHLVQLIQRYFRFHMQFLKIILPFHLCYIDL